MPHKIVKLLKVEIFPNIRQRIEVSNDLSIGRDPENQILLKDMSSSSQHAMVGLDGERVWIEDLGSTNGTHVNDNMIHKKYLEDHDLITIGYTKIWFVCEDEPTEWNPFSEKDIHDKDEVTISLPSQEEIIQKWCGIVLEKLSIWNIPSFGKAIVAAMENAYIHGNAKDTKKQIFFFIQKTNSQVCVMIQDQGNGFDYESKLKALLTQPTQTAPERMSGLGTLLKECDSIELNKKGNQIFLLKNLKSTIITAPRPKEGTATIALHEKNIPKIKKPSPIIRYFSLKYFQSAFFQKPLPIKMVVSGQPLRIFPENLEMKPIAMQNYSTPLLVHIRPVCPGCLVNPPFQEVDLFYTPNKIEFWITPLTPEPHCHASIHIIQEGKLIQIVKIPFITRNPYTSRWFLLATLWLPILMILIDIPNLPINRDLPALILWLLQGIQFLGGWCMFGIVLGLISLMIGIFLHWRNRPISSELVHFEVNLN